MAIDKISKVTEPKKIILKKYDYFKAFVKLTDFSLAASRILHDSIKHFDPNKLSTMLEDLHNIEHSEDIEKHEMMERLAHEFITPIEREDIIILSQALDDVTDTIEDVLIRIYMFNIKKMRKEALEFTDIITRSCDAMKKMMEEFCNFKKSKTIINYIIEINHLEEVGDKLYTNAVRDMHVNCNDIMETMTWSETFDRFEKCCDACENVANAVESVIMKNS